MALGKSAAARDATQRERRGKHAVHVTATRGPITECGARHNRAKNHNQNAGASFQHTPSREARASSTFRPQLKDRSKQTRPRSYDMSAGKHTWLTRWRGPRTGRAARTRSAHAEACECDRDALQRTGLAHGVHMRHARASRRLPGLRSESFPTHPKAPATPPPQKNRKNNGAGEYQKFFSYTLRVRIACSIHFVILGARPTNKKKGCRRSLPKIRDSHRRIPQPKSLKLLSVCPHFFCGKSLKCFQFFVGSLLAGSTRMAKGAVKKQTRRPTQRGRHHQGGEIHV